MPKKVSESKRKNQDLSPSKRSEIVIWHKSGKSERGIAAITKLPKSTVHDTIQKWKQTVSLMTKKRSGRPPKVTEQMLKRIDCYLKKNDEAVPKEIIRDLNLDLSTRTIKKV